MGIDVDRQPNACHLERALLGRLLMSPQRAAADLGSLKARHFSSPRHRLVFQTVESLRREGSPHELAVVVHRLADAGKLDAAGGHAYVSSLLDDAGTNPNLNHYVEGILGKARDRLLTRLSNSLYESAMTGLGRDHELRLRALVGRISRVGRFEIGERSNKHPTSWTQEDLMNTEFPEVRCVVDELVADEGVSILGGKKKVGKSWLCLQIAQAVAAGTPVLGKATTQGSVIYICLEDGPVRLARRLKQQSARTDLPITYLTRFTPLDQGGLDELRQLVERTHPRLIIIDTLAAAKTGAVDENAAGPMADLSNGLRAIAQDLHVAILVVAHHGKHTIGDPGHDIRGSSATPGAADLNLGLYKENGIHILRAEGRDIGEGELRVEFDAVTTWSWHLLGDAREMARTEAEGEILDAIEELGPSDAGRIARHLGKKRPGVQKTLKRMREQNRVPFRKDDQEGGKIIYGPWETPSE